MFVEVMAIAYLGARILQRLAKPRAVGAQPARREPAPARSHQYFLGWSLAALGFTALRGASPVLTAASIATLVYVNTPSRALRCPD